MHRYLVNAAVLVPEYQGYVAACVVHSSNSTFVSRTVNSAAFNYASLDGNTDISKGILKYNLRSSDYCVASTHSSVQVYDALVTSLIMQNRTLTVRRPSVCLPLSSAAPHHGL